MQDSHDGYYPDMDATIKAIKFCKVKQLYFPYSVHLFNGSFPAASPGDCSGTTSTANGSTCFGQPDTFGQYRRPLYNSLKVMLSAARLSGLPSHLTRALVICPCGTNPSCAAQWVACSLHLQVTTTLSS